MPFRLQVPENVLAAMIAQAISEQPNECCGLLAGVLETAKEATLPIGRVVTRLPLVNARASPTRYCSEERSLLDAHIRMRKDGLELLAIYHSHPATAPIPSRIDLADNPYEDSVVHLIVSLATSPPSVRGWRLTADSYREEEWEVIERIPEG
jgi:[CysO sulfur-carrier protein]-S-L-cysteine hydrolase